MENKETIEQLIRQNEELRIANMQFRTYNDYLNNENNYLKGLIGKILEQKKEGKENE